MRLPFYKYQATANDFVIINQMIVPYLKEPSTVLIERLCHRRWGIGADGLILMVPSEIADFKMVYYNSDGRLSTMCGNGGRAVAQLAHMLKIIGKEGVFEAVDGLHEVKITDKSVHLKMSEVNEINHRDAHAYVLDTGSPHYVTFHTDIDTLPIVKEAHLVRYSEEFNEEGINVNFVEILSDGDIKVRTYERGVEGETYSCGTGVVAAAVAYLSQCEADIGKQTIRVSTKGGDLEVRMNYQRNFSHDLWLIGPAEKVFEGIVELADDQL